VTARLRPPESDLHRAVRTGDHATVERLLAAGADVDERADLELDHGPHLRGLTPLMTAARSLDGASVATLRLLLDHGADLRARSKGGGDAAWYAAGRGNRLEPWRIVPNHVERLRFLLDAGLSPRGRNAPGSTCLGEACGAGDPARVALLLERGAPPGPDWSQENEDFRTSCDAWFGERRERGAGAVPAWSIPLFRAAESGSAECVRLLLDAGADVSQRDENESTALFAARSVDVVRELVRSGADVRAVDRRRDDALAAILEFGSTEHETTISEMLDVARALVEAGANPERASDGKSSRLHDAAFARNAEAVDFLLDLGVRPSADSHGRTPLHAIAWQSQDELPRMKAACERIIRALVRDGNPVDARDERGRTPLDEARGGDGPSETAIRVLLELGAHSGD
jgi:ankyrin repeat protein